MFDNKNCNYNEILKQINDINETIEKMKQDIRRTDNFDVVHELQQQIDLILEAINKQIRRNDIASNHFRLIDTPNE